VTMQPFRALVSDMVPDTQRNKGYSVQSFLINAGAVLGSMLPFILTYIGVANEPAPGNKVAPTVIWSFYLGGAALLGTVLWTSFKTKEYPPDEYKKYNNIPEDTGPRKSFWKLVLTMPKTMMQLAVTQFFSWFALFLMWVYTTNAIAGKIWGVKQDELKKAQDTIASKAAVANLDQLKMIVANFNEAGNWTGVIFAAYSLFAALYSLILPKLAEKYGRRTTYAFSLMMGGIGLISMLFISDKYLLFIPMIGIGMSWAAILAMPYAILSSSLPPEQTGVYMGIFNATITIPQIVAGFFGGILLLALGGQAISIIALAGCSMAVAGILAKVVITSEGH
ncbi:MAG TPA: MFS transporter, partial [Phnomibacter sp.]|nr:MFS transporter [Phnomibacter sp.]